MSKAKSYIAELAIGSGGRWILLSSKFRGALRQSMVLLVALVGALLIDAVGMKVMSVEETDERILGLSMASIAEEAF